jgi:hypothetical protein
MSPSPTGPGSWTRASTPAARETSGERTSLERNALAELPPERFNCPTLPQHSPRASDGHVNP